MVLVKKKISKLRRIDEVERLKAEFLAIASHELRTPLATIKNVISLISGGSAGPLNEDQHKFLAIANRNVDKLAHLINNFFLLSDLESSCVELVKSKVNINEIISNAAAAFSEHAKLSGILLTFEPDKTLDSVTADRYKISHVINNLILNAIKFNKPGGSVTVASSMYRPDRNFIKISVKDTGIGIDRKHFNKIFNKFQQIDSSLTRKFAGSGLGLAICKRVIELHEGKIWIESELGKGSTFHLALPMKKGRKS
jgi:signal transduction histidine kinase